MRFVRSTMMLLASALLLCGVLIAPTTANAVATGTLVVLPGQSIKAQFSGTRLDKKRAVALQQSGDGLKWATVKTVKMSATGLADLLCRQLMPASTGRWPPRSAIRPSPPP